MKSSILTLFLNLFLVTVSFGQSDSLLDSVKGKWFVEKMNSDTIILNKENVTIEAKANSFKTVQVHFYDDRVNRVDETVWDGVTSQSTTEIHANQHHVFGDKLKFKGYFEQSHAFKLCYLDSDRIILCKYKPEIPFD